MVQLIKSLSDIVLFFLQFYKQTNIAKVLIALNPHKDIKELYNENVMEFYRKNERRETDPHIYAIGEIKITKTIGSLTFLTYFERNGIFLFQVLGLWTI